MCGENASRFVSSALIRGSPPRVRGKHNKLDAISDYSRITPACAGKTILRHYANKSKKDHPRVCGENMRWFISIGGLPGSPPRVRGKLEI